MFDPISPRNDYQQNKDKEGKNKQYFKTSLDCGKNKQVKRNQIYKTLWSRPITIKTCNTCE